MLHLDPSLSAIDMVQRARQAEAAGFDGVYGIDALRDVFVPMAAIATATTRIRVGTYVANAYARTPQAAATAALQLDELSGGRFLLGLGSGNAHVNDWFFGLDSSKPMRKTREYLDVVTALLSGRRPDGPTVGGDIHRVQSRFVRPVARRVPVVLAAAGPRMIELAASATDGVGLGLLISAEHLTDEIRPRARAAAAAAGRDPDAVRFPMAAMVNVHDDEEQARALTRRAIVGLFHPVPHPYYEFLLRAQGYGAVRGRRLRAGTAAALGRGGRADRRRADRPADDHRHTRAVRRPPGRLRRSRRRRRVPAVVIRARDQRAGRRRQRGAAVPDGPDRPRAGGGSRMTAAVPPVRFGVAHDFRCPPGSSYTLQDVYAQTIEQIRRLDELGLDEVWFSEHHFVEDGYLPSFAPVAGAAAAVTKHMRISTNIAIVPFSHPLRLAEDLAILDQLSGGRIEFGVGLGYAPHEFRAFGFPVSHRVSRTEECVDILKLAWSGEPFSYSGKRYTFEDVRVTPDPVQPGGPPLWMAVSSWASVDRAVRYGVNVLPQGPVALLDTWREQTIAAGRAPEEKRVGIIRSFLVTDDPERDWPPLRAAERYRMQVYGRFFEAAGLGTSQTFNEAERISQRVFVGDVDACVAELTAYVLRYGLTDVVTWGSAPGMPPADLSPSMERFAAEVVPAVRANLAAAAGTSGSEHPGRI